VVHVDIDVGHPLAPAASSQLIAIAGSLYTQNPLALARIA
jgi:hypothetical protein